MHNLFALKTKTSPWLKLAMVSVIALLGSAVTPMQIARATPVESRWTLPTGQFPSDANLTSVAFGGGHFLATSSNFDPITENEIDVAQLSPSVISPDGSSWAGQQDPEAENAPAPLSSAAYCGNRFVAVAANRFDVGNFIPAYYLDDLGWHESTARGSSLNGVACGQYKKIDTLVAVGETGRVLTSTDLGETWNSQDGALGMHLSSVAFGEGLFVAVSSNNYANNVMTSPDGITWTQGFTPSNNAWTSVTYGNGIFVTVGNSGTGDRVMTSTNGINWTARASAADNNWTGVTYGNGLFVAVSSNGGGNNVMTSTDGITWTLESAPDQHWNSVAFGDGQFVAVSSDGANQQKMTMSYAPGATLTASRTSMKYIPEGSPLTVESKIDTTYPSNYSIAWLKKGTPGSDCFDPQTPGNYIVDAGGTIGSARSDSKLIPYFNLSSFLACDGAVGDQVTVKVRVYDPANLPLEGIGAVTTETQYEAEVTVEIGEATFATVDCETGSLTASTHPRGFYEIVSGVATNGGLDAGNCQGDQDGSLTLDPSVTDVADSAFADASLDEVIIPSSVVEIDQYSFSGISSLVRLTLGGSVRKIGNGAFDNADLSSLRIPASVETIGNFAFANAPLQSLDFDSGSSIKSIGDIAFVGANLTSINLPDSLETIGAYAFLSSVLNEITFGNSLKSIGQNAFASQNVTDLTIPESVSSIGASAFYGPYANHPRTLTISSPSISLGSNSFGSFLGTCFNNSGGALYIENELSDAGLPQPCLAHSIIATSGLNGDIGIDQKFFAPVSSSDPDKPTVLIVPNAGYEVASVFVSSAPFDFSAPLVTDVTPDLVAGSDNTMSYSFPELQSDKQIFATFSLTQGNTTFGWSLADRPLLDGQPWEKDWSSIIYEPITKKYIAGSKSIPDTVNSTGVWQSSDLVNWSSLLEPDIQHDWNSFATCRGTVAAVGDHVGNMAYPGLAGGNGGLGAVVSNTWRSITCGEGVFVAVGDELNDNENTVQVMTSKDGYTWTARISAEDNNWTSVTYGNGIFVAVSRTGDRRVMTSTNGINWTARTAAENNNWTSVTYGNGRFVAVASSGNNRVMTSPNGINWTARTAAENNNWTSVTYGDGRFVAVASSGNNRVMTSTNGSDWISEQAPLQSWNSVTYGNGQFVAVSSDGTQRFMTSAFLRADKLRLMTTPVQGQPGYYMDGDSSEVTTSFPSDYVVAWFIRDTQFSPLDGCSDQRVSDPGFFKVQNVTVDHLPDLTPMNNGVTCSGRSTIIIRVYPPGTSDPLSIIDPYLASVTIELYPGRIDCPGGGDYEVTIEGLAQNGEDCSGAVTLDDGVTSVGFHAFYDSPLVEVVIPNSVETIEQDAFSYSEQLTSVTFAPGSKLASIDMDAFRSVSNLTEITIPKSVVSIGDRAFAQTQSLRSIDFEPDSALSWIEGGAFSGSGLESVTLPNSVISIGIQSFANTGSLQSINLANVSEIGRNAFQNATALTSIVIPIGVTSIKYYTFDGATSLVSVTLPNTLTSIEEHAFSNASKLTTMSIPNSVTSIAEYAFAGTHPSLFSSSFQLTSLQPGANAAVVGDKLWASAFERDLSGLVLVPDSLSDTPEEYVYRLTKSENDEATVVDPQSTVGYEGLSTSEQHNWYLERDPINPYQFSWRAFVCVPSGSGNLRKPTGQKVSYASRDRIQMGTSANLRGLFHRTAEDLFNNESPSTRSIVGTSFSSSLLDGPDMPGSVVDPSYLPYGVGISEVSGTCSTAGDTFQALRIMQSSTGAEVTSKFFEIPDELWVEVANGDVRKIENPVGTTIGVTGGGPAPLPQFNSNSFNAALWGLTTIASANPPSGGGGSSGGNAAPTVPTNPPSVPQISKTQSTVILGFAGDSSRAPASLLQRINKVLFGFKKVVSAECTGYTSGRVPSRRDTQLANRRAQVVCDLVKRSNPSAKVKVLELPAVGVGAKFRSVRIKIFGF